MMCVPVYISEFKDVKREHHLCPPSPPGCQNHLCVHKYESCMLPWRPRFLAGLEASQALARDQDSSPSSAGWCSSPARTCRSCRRARSRRFRQSDSPPSRTAPSCFPPSGARCVSRPPAQLHKGRDFKVKVEKCMTPGFEERMNGRDVVHLYHILRKIKACGA